MPIVTNKFVPAKIRPPPHVIARAQPVAIRNTQVKDNGFPRLLTQPRNDVLIMARHCEERSDVAIRYTPFSYSNESYRSSHFGFMVSTNRFFLLLLHDFICFSLEIAA